MAFSSLFEEPIEQLAREKRYNNNNIATGITGDGTKTAREDEGDTLSNFEDIASKADEFASLFDRLMPKRASDEDVEFDVGDEARLAKLSNAFSQTKPMQVNFRDSSGVAGNPFSVKIGTGIQELVQGALNKERYDMQGAIAEDVSDLQGKKVVADKQEAKDQRREQMRTGFIMDAVNQELQFEYNKKIAGIKQQNKLELAEKKQDAEINRLQEQARLKKQVNEASVKLKDEYNKEDVDVDKMSRLYTDLNEPLVDAMQSYRRSIREAQEQLAELKNYATEDELEAQRNKIAAYQQELQQANQRYQENTITALNMYIKNGGASYMAEEPTKYQREQIEGLVSQNANITTVANKMITWGVDPNWLKNNYKGYYQQSMGKIQTSGKATGEDEYLFDGF